MFTAIEKFEQSKPTAFAPKVAIVIPVFKHSVLVAEAITCALNQDTDLSMAIIIVNDGCRFAETEQVCRDFALAYPERVTYLYRPNGGLSAARNTGIEFALTTWASIEAIYLLDADNRISPETITRSHQVLLTDPLIGWVYPTIDMFGKESGGDFDYRGEYSVLRHLRFNICEAGSMIRREVFEQGCRYDESMKLGFEDWEFWWQAIAKGYKGKHLPDSGFQYRKRFDSMLSNAERNEIEITNYMKRKHRNLFIHNQVMKWEQEAAPRYAIHLADTQQVILTSDPKQANVVLSVEDFFDHYHRGRTMPIRYHRPYFLVFTNSQVLDYLQNQKLLQGLFWCLEQTQEKAEFSLLNLKVNTLDALTVEKLDTNINLDIGESEHLIMTNVDVMDRCILHKHSDWLFSLICSNPLPKLTQIEIKLPLSSEHLLPLAGCVDNVFSTFRDLRWGIAEKEPSWDWHHSYLPYRALMYQDARQALECSPIYPRLAQSNQPQQIGFLLSILEFGGVEKVALNLAKVFQESGCSVHLFIFGTRMQQLPEWAEVFSTINFYHESNMSPWQGETYYGSKADAWSCPEEHQAAKGLLVWLDVAINFHNATSNSIMGQLKRAGVKTIASLHVHDLSPYQRPVGHTYLTLGYEHAYDFIIPCSSNMADWCHAIGIPEAKIVPMVNAAGYPLDNQTIKQITAKKLQRNPQDKLKVLFLGRFDRQKGLDRLVETVNLSHQLELPIEWRLVGKNVLQSNNNSGIGSLKDLIEPPALSTSELTQLYAWADVLFLPSYWEGLPLTILEAMRLGVVVCASDVGAVTEVIEYNRTGLIISNSDHSIYVQTVIALLQKLANNPSELKRLSLAAGQKSEQYSWLNSSRSLLAKLAN